jgi:G3E family GTPase
MTITTPVLTADNIPALDAWLRSVLWDSKLPSVEASTLGDDSKYEIHRLKARLPLSNGEVKIVQGVRDIFEILDSPNSSSGKESEGKIVLIGKGLTEKRFRESFLATIKAS